VAQAIEYLLCKCEALSSNPVPPKEKKKKYIEAYILALEKYGYKKIT
jgi:hypothetical protein